MTSTNTLTRIADAAIDDRYEPRGLSAAERPVAGRVTSNPVVSNTQEEGT